MSEKKTGQEVQGKTSAHKYDEIEKDMIEFWTQYITTSHNDGSGESLDKYLDAITPDDKSSKSLDDIVSENITETIRCSLCQYMDTNSFKKIAEVFPDAEQWTKEQITGDTPTTALTFLRLIQSTIDELPQYLEDHKIERSLYTFVLSESEDGYAQSPLMAYIGEELEKGKEDDKDTLSPSVRPATHSIMNDRVVNELIKGDSKPEKHINSEGHEQWLIGVNQAPKKSKKQVPVFIGLTDRKTGSPIKTSRYIEPEDFAILESIGDVLVTELIQGQSFPITITPDEIWRKENGIDDIYVSPAQSQHNEILDRVDKMRYTDLFMDLTQEAQANYINQLQDDRISEGTVNDYFLEASYKKIRTEKGRLVDAYRFPEMPFILKYCIAKGHMIFVDYDLLDTSDTTSGMTGIEPLRRYLLTQIELIYRHERDNLTIRFDTIYSNGGIRSPEERAADYEKERPYKNDATRNVTIRKFAKEDRTKVAAILESYTKRGYIKGYTLIKQGRKYTGVRIKPNPDNYRKTPEELGENPEQWTNDAGRMLKELI